MRVGGESELRDADVVNGIPLTSLPQVRRILIRPNTFMSQSQARTICP